MKNKITKAELDAARQLVASLTDAIRKRNYEAHSLLLELKERIFEATPDRALWELGGKVSMLAYKLGTAAAECQAMCSLSGDVEFALEKGGSPSKLAKRWRDNTLTSLAHDETSFSGSGWHTGSRQAHQWLLMTVGDGEARVTLDAGSGSITIRRL